MVKQRTILTRELYGILLEGFRGHPAEYQHVSRVASVSRDMAKTAWKQGWVHRFAWARPIEQVLEEEVAAGEARRVELRREEQRRVVEVQEAERARGAKELRDALEQEVQTLKVARGDVLSALVIAAELTPAMRTLAKVVVEACRVGADGSLPQIAPGAAMGLLTRHATLIQKAVGAAEAVITLSRLDRGQTTVNVGVGAGAEGLSLEAALEELAAVEEVLRAAQVRQLPVGKPGNGHGR